MSANCKKRRGKGKTSQVRKYGKPVDNELVTSSLPHNKTDVLPRVWYRHSGQPHIDKILYRPTTESLDERQIVRDVGENYITHMHIENGVVPSLAVVAPQVTHLEILGVSASSQLHRLGSLTQLKNLNLSNNNFRAELPAVVGELTSLEKLSLSQCQLSDLPPRFSCAAQLKTLDLCFNNFKRLPPAVHHLYNLKELNLQSNKKLRKLDEEISQLQNLEQLWCHGCESLQSPPYAVCRQGLKAVKKYFADLKVEKGKELLLVPVAVVGTKSSGKSSLIKSLQAGERRLTFRDENSPLDETTKVFAVEELQLEDCRVKFVDYGGHEIYHLAYQLVIKERCVPLIVVNIEEFHKLSQSEGVEEATRKLCIDWCSHLYLACPQLGSPVLILTHTDKLAVGEVKQCKEQLLTTSEAIRRKIVNEIQQCSGEFSKNAHKMVHFANKEVPLFDPMDVFEFNNDLAEVSNIVNLKVSLENHCKSFKVEIPRLWEKVEEFVNEQDTKSYISLSEVTNKFSSNDPQIILRYMHNVGKILWFEEIEELTSYIFHDIPAITEMISLLLHHSSGEQWKQRIARFTPFPHKGMTIGQHKYESLVSDFASTGVIDEAVLAHVLETGSRFPINLAIDLLKGFLILHGPIEQDQQNRKAYILPYIACSFLDDSWKTAGPVPLRLEIVFGGLSPPQYVYQLMTVIVLNRTRCVLTDVSVKSDGVTIRHGKCSTSLVHDVSHRKITLQVSTPVVQLHKVWKHLVKTSRSILHQLSRVWKACHAEVLVYCAQCLFLRLPDPGCDVDPYWLHSIEGRDDITSVHTVTTNSALEEVLCARCSSSKDRSPDVPKPFKFPCEELSKNDIRRLNRHISDTKQAYSVISAADNSPITAKPNKKMVRRPDENERLEEPEILLKRESSRREEKPPIPAAQKSKVLTTVAVQASGEREVDSFSDYGEAMTVSGEKLESNLADVDTETTVDEKEIKAEPTNDVYTLETTKDKEINTTNAVNEEIVRYEGDLGPKEEIFTKKIDKMISDVEREPTNFVYIQGKRNEVEINTLYDGGIKDPEGSVLIQKKTVQQTKLAEARIAELEARVAELEATNVVLAAKNVELENELSAQKLLGVNTQAREETGELKGVTKNIDISFQDTVQDTVVESKHSIDVDNKHPVENREDGSQTK